MKYALARELPFAKKGQILLTDGYGDTVTVEDPHQFGQRLYVCLKKEIPQMIESGWIEEIKPREFTNVVLVNGKPYRPDTPSITAIDKVEYVRKVREVIE